MKLTEKVKSLMGETKENISGGQQQSLSNHMVHEQEGKDMSPNETHAVLNIFIVALQDSIENLNNSIYTFSAATNKIDEDKKEMEKLARDVAKLKLDVGTALSELQRTMKVFPSIASESIKSSVGATSAQLEAATNGLISEVRHAISHVFKEETKNIKQAANDANKSAEAMKKAKEFVGWQFFTANTIAVTIIALMVTMFVSPAIKWHGQSSEDKKYITYGKTFEAVWQKLPEKTKLEIKALSSDQ